MLVTLSITKPDTAQQEYIIPLLKNETVVVGRNQDVSPWLSSEVFLSRRHLQLRHTEEGIIEAFSLGANQCHTKMGVALKTKERYEFFPGDTLSLLGPEHGNTYVVTFGETMATVTKDEESEEEKEIKQDTNRALSPPTLSRKRPAPTSTLSEDESYALALQLQEEEHKPGLGGFYSPPSPSALSSQRSAILLDHGVILLKNCLSIDQQIGVWQICKELNSQNQYWTHSRQTGPHHIQPHPIPFFQYNWGTPGLGHGGQLDREPTELLEFGAKMFDEGYDCLCRNQVNETEMVDSLPEDFVCPEGFKPESLNAIVYGQKGALMSHVDGVRGWVLNVSLGCAAIFFWSAKAETNGRHQNTIQMESGDAVIFNGAAHYHGIESISSPDTAPAFWNDSGMNSVGSGTRVSIQFRSSPRVKTSTGRKRRRF